MPTFSRVTWKAKPGASFKGISQTQSVDIYIDMNADFAYLEGLIKFLKSKNLNIAPLTAGQNLSSGVVLAKDTLKFNDEVKFFKLTEDKATLWAFLQQCFKDRL